MKSSIRMFRAKYDLTQAELAERVGVRRETILQLEKGRYNPSLRLAVALCRVLHTTVEELFGFEESELQPGSHS